MGCATGCRTHNSHNSIHNSTHNSIHRGTVNRVKEAETALVEILSADVDLMKKVRQIERGFREIADYGDRLPAIGIGYDDSGMDEDGNEWVSGICEVVVKGEMRGASELSMEIGSMVYEILSRYSEAGAELTAQVQSISGSGMRPVTGKIGTTWIALTHVDWTVQV